MCEGDQIQNINLTVAAFGCDIADDWRYQLDFKSRIVLSSQTAAAKHHVIFDKEIHADYAIQGATLRRGNVQPNDRYIRVAEPLTQRGNFNSIDVKAGCYLGTSKFGSAGSSASRAAILVPTTVTCAPVSNMNRSLS